MPCRLNDRYSIVFGCFSSLLKCHTGLGGKPNNLYYAYSDYTIKSCLVITTTVGRHVLIELQDRYDDSWLRSNTDDSVATGEEGGNHSAK